MDSPEAGGRTDNGAGRAGSGEASLAFAARVPEQLPAVLVELWQAMAGACETLIRFDPVELAGHMELQQRLTSLLRQRLAECGGRRLPAGVARAIRELVALNRVQQALLDGACRAVQLERNLTAASVKDASMAGD